MQGNKLPILIKNKCIEGLKLYIKLKLKTKWKCKICFGALLYLTHNINDL